MTHTLSITDDAPGSTTMTLTDSTMSYLLSYVPRAPDVDVETVNARLVANGGDVRRIAIENVTESARVLLVGSTTAEVQGHIQTLEKYFRQAEAYQETGQGNPVFAKVKVSGEALTYRSEILTGRVELTDNAWSLWNNKQAEVVIVWTRRFYWELANDPNLFLASAHTSRTQNWVTVTNNATQNYVHVLGSDVAGSLAAPARLLLRNDSGSVTYRDIFIGHYIARNLYDNPALTLNYTASPAYTWASAITTPQQAHVWTVDATTLLRMAGRYFRVLGRFSTLPLSDTYVQMRVMRPTGSPLTTIYRAGEVRLGGDYLQDLGVVQLPPSLGKVVGGGLTPTALALTLYVRNTAFSSGALGLDWIFLTPLDGWRRLDTSISLGSFVSNETFVDDGATGNVYTSDASGNVYPSVRAWGNPPLFWPGRDQRLYILHHHATGMTTTHTWGVQAIFRQRRLTL